MAEPPSPLTAALGEERYDEFLRLVKAQGVLRDSTPDVLRVIAALHQELKAVRHPPGPTVEWLVIERLVQRGILDTKLVER